MGGRLKNARTSSRATCGFSRSEKIVDKICGNVIHDIPIQVASIIFFA